MNDFTTLHLVREPQGVATLWLARPEKHNAFDALMIAELNRALEQLAADDTLRLLLLRGRGKHFSAGADLAWMRACASLDQAANLQDAHELGELMARLQRLPCPTLAVVQGAAFGGALGLIACCDLAIGAQDALFSLSEVRIGLAPAVISPYLVQAIGARATRRYALSGERFDAQRAQQLGLLAEVYPAQGLDAAVDQWSATLLLNGPQALRATKALLRELSGAPDEAQRLRCETLIATLRTGEEGQEGLAAFLEKRAPGWQGGSQ